MPEPDGRRPPATDRLFLAGVIALAFAMNAIGRGFSETFAVFLLPVEQALGVERAEISATYAIYMLAYAGAAPFAGQIVDRWGPRMSYALGLALMSAGFIAAGAAGSIWAYYLGAGICVGVASATLGMVTASSLIARWFTERLGFLSALPYAAMGLGMILFPPLAQVLIGATDWRMAYRLLAGLSALALVAVLVLPLGRMTAGSPAWQSRRDGNAATGVTWTMSSAVRTGGFWALFLAYFMTSVAAYAVLPHSVAFLIEQGFAPLTAASAFGVTGLMSAVGIIAMGWLSDRWGRLPTVTVSYLSTIAGVACLLAVTRWPSLVLVYGFVTLYGLMQGARGPILVALVARLFEGGSVGTIFGALSMALGLGAAAGSYLSGVLHEVTGSYVAGFAVSIVASCAGMATFWFSGPIRRERIAKAPAAP